MAVTRYTIDVNFVALFKVARGEHLLSREMENAVELLFEHKVPLAIPRFGPVVTTPGLRETCGPEEALLAFWRHIHGDWGECCPEDRQLNDLSLVDGSRILSVYSTKNGKKFWIITDAVMDSGERYATTMLLPEEY